MRMGSRIKNKQSQFSIPQSVSINNTSATKAVQFIIAYHVESQCVSRRLIQDNPVVSCGSEVTDDVKNGSPLNHRGLRDVLGQLDDSKQNVWPGASCDPQKLADRLMIMSFVRRG